jgi:hypothetical protein
LSVVVCCAWAPAHTASAVVASSPLTNGLMVLLL